MTHGSVPTPKVNSTAVRNKQTWYRFYAMFSQEFAERAIEEAGLSTGSIVFDPWIGAGTTAAVASKLGFRCIGVDVNPVMVAISRGRCIHTEDAKNAIDRFVDNQPHSDCRPFRNDPLLEWFKPAAAGSVRRLAQSISDLFPDRLEPAKNGFLITTLFETTLRLAKHYRSKNPTWVKKPASENRISVRSQTIDKLFLEVAKHKLSIHASNSKSAIPSIQLGTATHLELPNSFADLVLTSPPYCTRIDYAMSTAIELAVLGFSHDDVRQIRQQSTGTTVIRKAPAVESHLWGGNCLRLLAGIQSHKSKSSASYYYKNFLQYFDDLHKSLSETVRCLRDSGTLIIVVQDSYYKDILVDLPLIVEEMLMPMELIIADSYRFDVSKSMRQVNTKSRNHQNKLACAEVVLVFKRR